jgi:hypothetical protein
MLNTFKVRDNIAYEIGLIPKDSETVFLVVFKFENKSHGFVNINYLAIFDTHDQASEYIKHSPSFEYLTIHEVKSNINILPTKIADYGVKIVYDIRKQQIVNLIKGFFPIEEFELPYTHYEDQKRAYLVSTIMPVDEINMDSYAINSIVSNSNNILETIAAKFLTDLAFMNSNPESPNLESVIDHTTRQIKLRILGLEFGTVKVVNYISPYDIESIQNLYSRYLEKGSSELNNLILKIRSAVDRFL